MQSHSLTQQQTRATVGIVVPTVGDRPEWLRQCLASIVSQEGVHTRILVVGPDVPLLRELKADGFDVLFQPLSGLSRAINAGVDLLRPQCEFVGWLGDDDLLAKEACARVVAALTRNPRAIFAFGKTRYISGDGAYIYVALSGRWAVRYARIGKNFISQPGSLFRVSLVTWDPFLDVGLRNSMDLDLFLRASSLGEFEYVSAEVSSYRLHESAITAQKGQLDESALVRARWNTSLDKRLLTQKAVRLLVAVCERVFVAAQWHTSRGRRTWPWT